MLKMPQPGPDFGETSVVQSPFLGWTPSSAVPTQQLPSVVAPDPILAPWIVPLLRPALRSQRFLWASLPYGRSAQGFSWSLLQALPGPNCGRDMNAGSHSYTYMASPDAIPPRFICRT